MHLLWKQHPTIRSRRVLVILEQIAGLKLMFVIESMNFFM